LTLEEKSYIKFTVVWLSSLPASDLFEKNNKVIGSCNDGAQ